MLFWRPNVHKKPNMFKRALLATMAGHVFVLCMLFCWYQGSKVYDLTLSKNNHQGTVVFLPFYKRVGGMTIGHGGPGNGMRGRAKQAPAPVVPPVKPVVQAALPKPEEPAASVPDIRTMVQAHEAAIAKVEKKKTRREKKAEARKKAGQDKKHKKEQQKKKKETKKERKKRLEKLKSEKLKLEKPKPEVKKVEPKKVPEKKVEPEKKPEPIKSELPTPEPVVPVEQLPEGPIEFSITGEDGQVTYVGQEEYEVLMVQEHIQQELERCWQPPVGMDGLACTIRVALDWEGKVKTAQVQKASGVLAFDVPARCAVMAMEYPKLTWGKELVLHFKQ